MCDDSVVDGSTDFNLEIQTPIIQDGDTNLTVTYYALESDAEAGNANFIDETTPYDTSDVIIFVRVEDAAGCYDTFEMQLEVISVTGVIPLDLVVCDEVINDGKAIFNLTQREGDILNGQTAAPSYYELEADADAGNTNFINNPNAYEAFSSTVYARLTANDGDCFSVVPLELEVRRPIAIETNILPYELCDNDQSGDENFDLLTWGVAEILNGLTNVTLTYYITPTDADLGDPVNEIPTPTAYTSAGTETIWVRAVNLEGCVTVSSFELIIDTVPIFTEVPLFQVCDDDTPDGITEFDLESQTPTIVAGDTNLVVTYHLTEADAEAGTTPSLSSPYTNTINPEPVWVRVEDTTTTGCYVAFEMQLNVISPIAGTPDLFVLCDEVPNDGFARFDLFEADDSIINGQSDMLVTYHLTLIDAEAVSYTHLRAHET